MLTAPTAVQVVPLLTEYCHVPVPATRLVTAMPCTAPESESVIWPAINVDTRSPALVVWSSLIVVKFTAPASTGAVLTAVEIALVTAAMAVMPPLAVVLTLTRVSVPAVVEKPAI